MVSHVEGMHLVVGGRTLLGRRERRVKIDSLVISRLEEGSGRKKGETNASLGKERGIFPGKTNRNGLVREGGRTSRGMANAVRENAGDEPIREKKNQKMGGGTLTFCALSPKKKKKLAQEA